jgi:hypothetical protein
MSGPPAALAAQLELYTPRGRPAEELVPLVAPLLEPEGTAVADPGSGKLLLRGSAEALRAARAVLEQIDVVPRQYRVETRIEERESLTSRGLSIEGWIEVGDVRIGRVREPARRRGHADSRVEIRVREYRTTSRERFASSVVVIEGREAEVWTGSLVPVHARVYDVRAQETRIVETRMLEPVRTGFAVRPRAAGEGAIELEIVPIREQVRARGGAGSGDLAISQTGASTRVRVQPGEWIAIGRLQWDEEDRESELFAVTTRDALTGDSLLLVRATQLSDAPDEEAPGSP